jgi:hypothetical protein
MINQSSFYASISEMGASTQVIAKFRQVGDIAEAGYLPKNSQGTCSFTTLDFHRAVSQGTEKEWMSMAGEAKRSSALWQLTFGEKGSKFGARQQLNFLSPEHTAEDKLFTRSLPEGGKLTGDQTHNTSRKERVRFEVFAPDILAGEINGLLSEDSKAYLRLNFNLIDDKGKEYGHTIAICPSGDENKLYIMDPNVGVILTNREDLSNVLDSLRNNLYKDFVIAETFIETQDKFWLDPVHPLTDEQIQQFQESEVSLLNQFSLSDYERYQNVEAEKAKIALDAIISLSDEEESVFDDKAWDELPEFEGIADSRESVARFKSELDMMQKIEPSQAHKNENENENENENQDAEWDRVNENTYRSK